MYFQHKPDEHLVYHRIAIEARLILSLSTTFHLLLRQVIEHSLHQSLAHRSKISQAVRVYVCVRSSDAFVFISIIINCCMASRSA